MIVLRIGKISILFCFLFFLSCGEKIEKSWVITDFSVPHQFEVEVPKTEKVVNANVYLEGNF